MDQEVIPNKKDEVTDENLFTVRMVSGTKKSAIIVRPEVNGVNLSMELDTGAKLHLFSEDV